LLKLEKYFFEKYWSTESSFKLFYKVKFGCCCCRFCLLDLQIEDGVAYLVFDAFVNAFLNVSVFACVGVLWPPAPPKGLFCDVVGGVLGSLA
jgi:hypothetical protein